MKISLSGCQGTGKTTLLKKIEEEAGLFCIKEVIRELKAKHNISFNKECNYRSQLLILNTHLQNALIYPNFITDRSSIDAFVYAIYSYQQKVFTEEEFRNFKRLFQVTLPLYDKFFYLPIEFDLKDDGVRSMDDTYRNETDKIFRGIFKEYRINFIELKGSVEDRVKDFKNYIK